MNLRGLDPTNTPVRPAEALHGFLDVLGISPGRIPTSVDAQAGLYRSLLTDWRVLVVLDNARDVPGISRKEVTRHKAYGHTTNHKTG